MKVEVIMPQLGESIAEGTVSKWLKKEGERVKKEEPLYEISTDKVDTEIPSPENGVLEKIIVAEGQTVPINTVLAIIRTEEASEVIEEEKEKVEKKLPIELREISEEKKEILEGKEELRKYSPAVRKLIREHNIDVRLIRGSGEGGRITARDVLNFIESKEAIKIGIEGEKAVEEKIIEVSEYKKGEEERIQVVPMSPMRKRIAEHMVMSKRTSPHVTTVFEVDMTNIVNIREKLKPQFEKEGVKLTYIAFVAYAAVQALKAFPIVNASVSGDNIIYKKDINIGIAVALEWGLIVPVIKNADRKSLLGLAQDIQDLAERARTKKLKPDDVQGGTFSITNPGVFGALFGSPIINQPQVAILGMGAITKRPVIINDAIAIRNMMFLSLSYDHRIIDGAIADQFLMHIKKTLENWM